MEKIDPLQEEVHLLKDKLFQETQAKEKMAASLLQAQEEINVTRSAKETMEREKESLLLENYILMQEVDDLLRDADLKEKLESAAMDEREALVEQVEVLADQLFTMAEAKEKMFLAFLQAEEKLHAALSAKEATDREKKSLLCNDMLLPEVEASRKALKCPMRVRKYIPTLSPTKEEEEEEAETPTPNGGCSIKHKKGGLRCFWKRLRKSFSP